MKTPPLKIDRRGFTLTELAIVLGIIGLILGAIWTAASKVYANNRVTLAVQETLSIVQGVRSIYGGKGVVDPGNLQPSMTSFGVFPSAMVQTSANCTDGVNPCPISPWGNDVLVGSQNGWAGAPSSAQRFEIYFRGSTSATAIKDCAAFAGAIISQAQNSGLTFVYVGGVTINPVSSTTLITAVSGCTPVGDIEFQFTL